MASLESILWIISFLWTMYELYIENVPLFGHTIIKDWLGILCSGVLLCRFAKRPTSIDTETPSGTSSDEQQTDHPIKYDGDKGSKFNTRSPISSNEYTNRIFGATKASFRADADDGLLCGVLLLPMVTTSKLVDASRRGVHENNIAYLQVRLELVLLMSAILLTLIITNEYLRPLKHIIRKRGLFVSSILVSSLFTTFITGLFPLAPLLSQTPVMMTIVSITMFQWFLYICVVTLKKCFTLGEMCIVSQAAAVVVHGAVEYIFTAYFPDKIPHYLHYSYISTSNVLVHALIVGMILIGIITYPVLRQCRRLAQRPYWRSMNSNLSSSMLQNKKILNALLFYLLTAFIVLFIVSPICKTITGENPLLWTLDYLYMSPSRMFLCLYWSLTVIFTIVIWVLVLDFMPQSSSPDQPVTSNNGEGKVLTATLNKKRKMFHALAVVMFVPGVLFELQFLQLAFCVALAAFIYLEYLRYFAVWPWGKSLHVFLIEFIDNRDLGPVILSHIYLLLGCAGPVWLGSSNVMANLCGILSLGFGDAAASLVGKKYGKYRWWGTKKTVEGTLAFIVAVLASSFVIVYCAAFIGVDEASRFISSAGRSEWLNYTFIITLTGLLEAFSRQNDNIVIPLYMYTLVILNQSL
ncbi:hypothetical protein BDB01DRAFT_793921 [Pilobolus umbonatus]|nr:hypothetical protein BDB01DRAFT_793921 [Pilobolus umbonatus]